MGYPNQPTCAGVCDNDILSSQFSNVGPVSPYRLHVTTLVGCPNFLVLAVHSPDARGLPDFLISNYEKPIFKNQEIGEEGRLNMEVPDGEAESKRCGCVRVTLRQLGMNDVANGCTVPSKDPAQISRLESKPDFNSNIN
ncbi:hypothetical protein L1887_09209 [Cichorium endivia]|nr:hypothetical protein L1887_09209 [Cichorium endivia]